MRVFIAGIDGYLGWPLAQHLAARGHTVAGADALLRRAWVGERGSVSAVPIAPVYERLAAFRELSGEPLPFSPLDLRDHPALGRALAAFGPDAVVHLAECPSAPYSMIDFRHADFVQSNNVSGTLSLLFAMREHCPGAHLVKLGTMGEYGTPDLDIPEGFFDVEFRGRRDRLPFPRQAGSWYHWSKVFDSQNVGFACRLWGLAATDVMQGVVYGSWCPPADPRLNSRLDFDEAFGTAVNRFCCQAVIGRPITPYGNGTQSRGLLSLADCLQCLTLVLEHPPAPGEYRVVNQLRDVLSVGRLAELVRDAARALGIDARIAAVDNPRDEAEAHRYNPDSEKLRELGFKPSAPIGAELRQMIGDLLPHADRVRAHADRLPPTVRWRRPVIPNPAKDPTEEGTRYEPETAADHDGGGGGPHRPA
ncbi:NAD-dependent epimerase/dehydratase family protein [Streptomyces abikoensis]|uniref:NAD-dependent epimerase/dehydratase family protein n=2 Tax=Streptomyces TaxID=1883 RepID=A0A3S9PGI9_STRLT|nr:NAD-dependent epimerase/dehydratase family protein [Streptomyces luteoverticillatus]AZQ71479.1 NAD-dependent epimerase/dehydratase family protein [Streptomyces luteoverticillatus]